MPAILLDSCVWGGAVPALADQGHDVVWSGAWPSDPGDVAILAAAYDARRILVTLDKDFGELAILKGQPHSGIIRQAGFRVGDMADAIHRLVTVYENDLMAGAILTAEPERVRIRMP
jgi:predicted nuclease of predicted toxin-antitoxin system